MGRTPNTDERRHQIIKALEKLLPLWGYQRSTIAAIAAEAGVAPGIVHYHFQSKQEILLELVRDLGERLNDRHKTALERAGRSPRARLEAWLDAHVELGPGADPAAVACWSAISAEASRQPEVQAVYEAALETELERLETLLFAVVTVRRQRLRAMATGLLAAIQGAYLLGTSAPQLTPKGFARPALRAMLDGLLASCHE